LCARIERFGKLSLEFVPETDDAVAPREQGFDLQPIVLGESMTRSDVAGRERW
jgi:hypothetical protein